MKLITTSLIAFFTLQSQPPLKIPEIRHQDWTPPVQIRSGFSNRQHSHDLFISQVDPKDYAVVENDGQRVFIHKSQLPCYRPQFNLGLVHLEPAASAAQDFFSNSYADDPKYFAKHFQDCYPEQIFHCLANYRCSGFRQYVRALPGFNDFIESIGPELESDGALHKAMSTDHNHLKCFEILQNIHNQQCYDQAKVAGETKRRAQIGHLEQQHFSHDGIRLLYNQGAMDEFLYHYLPHQKQQFEQIVQHLNETGEFWQAYQHDYELVEIANQSAQFGIMANHALKNNATPVSQTLLEIGQNFLAFGRGLVAGCERNLCAIYSMGRHPIKTGQELAGFVKNIGLGIGKAASLIPKLGAGLLLQDQALIKSAQKDVDQYRDVAKQICKYVKKTWQDKSVVECYELAGNIMVDLLLLKAMPVAASKLAPIKNLAQYKPQAFSKLGNVGREINQIAGLTCAKGVKAVEKGFEIIKTYPEIVQGQQLLGEAMWHGNKCLKASNQYLQKLSRHAVKCALNSARRLVRFGEHVKKLPKACIAKTKQLIGEEVVVMDALGNTWRSKIGKSDWVTEFSEQGNQALMLLNEISGGLKGAVQEAFQHYRTVPYSEAAREALNIMKCQFEAVERELQALGTTLKDFYGSHVTGKLADQLIHFKGRSHLMAATIKRNIKGGGIAEKITGLHWDYGRKLEQLGVYSLSEIEHLVGGMYEATLHYGGVIKKGKTFFPNHWDAKMLASKISEACCNAVKITLKDDGILEMRGVIEEGFQIVVKIGKRGNIITVYPEVAAKIL